MGLKPFHDIIFCPTGIVSEGLSRSLSKKIIKLGGKYSKDLTRQVNVIICGSKDTNKYKFAVRFRPDIVFIDIDAVESFYQRWLAGDDIQDSLGLLRNRYCNRPFENFIIFIGRIKDYPVQKLEDICHAGNCLKCYSKHFVRDAGNANNGKVVFIADSLNGARVKAAMELDIPIVHYKWLLDCQRRNATLEYDPYFLVSKIPQDTPIEKIGIDSCSCWGELIPTVLEEQKTATGNPLTKFKIQGDKIWERVMSIDKAKMTEKISTDIPLLNEKKTPLMPSLVFQGSSFNISTKFKSDQSSILQRVIEQNGGSVSKTGDYVIIPSHIPLNQCLEDTHGTIVTEFFVERCLHYKKIISPPDTWSKPFLKTKEFQFKASEKLKHNIDKLKIAITGFHGVELLHLTKILKAMRPMGVELTEYLNKSTDLLIINLSALPSIPKSHALWQNQYGDLFSLQTSNDSSSKNQLARNSIKRKIEFIKQTHLIPGVTPSFLFEILGKTSGLADVGKDSVYLNNINWCLICPRGLKEDFRIDIIRNPTFSHKIEIPFNTDTTISNPTIKETRLELLQKIKESESEKCEPRKRIASQSSSPEPTLSFKAKKIHSVKVQTITRTARSSSWGNLMSDKGQDDPNKSVEISEDPPTFNSDNYTQVTYGTANDVNPVNVRKLTRKHLRDIDI